jgi:hypothetical protein
MLALSLMLLALALFFGCADLFFCQCDDCRARRTRETR